MITATASYSPPARAPRTLATHTTDGARLDSLAERSYWPGPGCCGLCDAGIGHCPGECDKYAG